MFLTKKSNKEEVYRIGVSKQWDSAKADGVLVKRAMLLVAVNLTLKQNTAVKHFTSVKSN